MAKFRGMDTPADYAPKGRLRVALNFGNPILVGRDDAGEPSGITVDLAHELASSIGVDLQLVLFDRAFDVSSTAEHDEWDICFLAVDPERERTIAFTAPYVRIAGCYLLRGGTNARTNDEVMEGVLRIGVVQGSAYALFLSRRGGADNLVIFPTLNAALAALDQGAIDGMAGIEQVLEEQAALRPGSRVLQPPFMEIRQAIGIPKPRGQLIADLQARLSELQVSGILPRILERHGLSGG